MRFKASHEPTIIAGLPAGIQIGFAAGVLDFILHELRRHPRVEEGGKYIGYLDTRLHSRITQITITDFLPGGPLARRTAVEFMPDGEFQETLFRKAEQRDGAVEHLGSWHSHHCNGLMRFSAGDISGYFKTLTKPAYRPPVFIASLVKEIPARATDMDWIDHFLFLKGEKDRFYKITDHINRIDAQSRFGDITGHEIAPRLQPNADFWYQTERGQATLSADQKQFRSELGLTTKATRNLGVISIRCQVGTKFMCVSYPERPNDDSLRIEVGVVRPLLSIQCSLSDRRLGFAAGLYALEKADG